MVGDSMRATSMKGSNIMNSTKQNLQPAQKVRQRSVKRSSSMALGLVGFEGKFEIACVVEELPVGTLAGFDAGDAKYLVDGVL